MPHTYVPVPPCCVRMDPVWRLGTATAWRWWTTCRKRSCCVCRRWTCMEPPTRTNASHAHPAGTDSPLQVRHTHTPTQSCTQVHTHVQPNIKVPTDITLALFSGFLCFSLTLLPVPSLCCHPLLFLLRLD